MIPRVKPYTAKGWKSLACATDNWADGDPFEETKWYHMLNIVPTGWRGQEFPDIFDVVKVAVSKAKRVKRPRGKKMRQMSLGEVFA